jgi:hypothetical protein
MARPLQFTEIAMVRLPQGTGNRIRDLAKPNKAYASTFIRRAVLSALEDAESKQKEEAPARRRAA